jgi:predicted regulator of Ras-like GTPase activity (Roadblock/LC7/MglB family)
MTPHYVNQGGELSWLLDDLVKRVPQVAKAVMLTQDGLAIGASAGLSREDAEHLAALAAGFQSMARGAGEHFGGGRVRQTIIEMESAFLFVSAAGHGTCLAVLSTGDADIGLVAYEMAVLVRRSNEHLGVAARPSGVPGGGYPQGGGNAPHSGGYQPGAPYQQGYPGPGPGTSYQAPQPRVAPAPNSVYAPYPTPAGPSGPAPYPG